MSRLADFVRHSESKTDTIISLNEILTCPLNRNQNMARIRGLAGLQLEGLQSLDAVANARQTYLNAIIAYNQAQFLS